MLSPFFKPDTLKICITQPKAARIVNQLTCPVTASANAATSLIVLSSSHCAGTESGDKHRNMLHLRELSVHRRREPTRREKALTGKSSLVIAPHWDHIT